jgi:hypothetical protein
MAYYQYTVKYLCGESNGEILGRGVYRTAINIHNPHAFLQRPVCWKVLSPTPDGNPTMPTPWQRAELLPDWGMEINCRSISAAAAAVPSGFFPTGFVVIHSPNELDVVTVYTVEPPDQPVVQFKIETIAPRIIQTDQEMCPG